MKAHNSDRNRGIQDRLNRIAQRLSQKFGNEVYSEGGNTGGIPLNVLERAAGNMVIRDSVGSENPSAISFTLNRPELGKTFASEEQITVNIYSQQNFPAGLCGSALPLVMLAKLKAGLDSVDFHVVADSNASNGALAANDNMGGWNGGLIKGLIRGCCAAMYATPIQPLIIHPSSHSAAGIPAAGGAGLSHAGAASGSSFRMINASLFDGATSQVWADGATMQSGNFHAPTDLKQYFDIKNAALRMTSVNGGYTADFAYVSSGLTFVRGNEAPTATAIYPYIVSQENSNIDTRKALTYRVVHATIPNGGSIALHMVGLTMQNWTPLVGITTSFSNPYYIFAPVSGESSTDYAKHFKRVSVAGATGITASWHTWAADTTRVGVTLNFNWYGLGVGFGGNTYAKGPFAAYLDSVHNNSKGFAINNIIYNGGAQTSLLANTIDAVSTPTGSDSESALKTILKETRERQIQAGGSGNVIVFVNSGINDAGAAVTSETYLANLQKLVSAYQSTWESLQYPENDLAFIVTTTHPTQFPDSNQSGYRTIGKTLNSSKANVLFADLTALGSDGITFGGLTAGNSFSGNTNLYESGGTSHLSAGSSGGYAYLAELLIKRCLRYNVSY
jgi:hypothetical protein